MSDSPIKLCDVCNQNNSIGVASTSMPISVAYCAECAQRNADPELVFMCMYDNFGTKFHLMHEELPDLMVTFKDGKYITYREWAEAYSKTNQLCP